MIYSIKRSFTRSKQLQLSLFFPCLFAVSLVGALLLTKMCPIFSEAFPAVWSSVCSRWSQQHADAKQSLLVNVICQRIEAHSSIALPWSHGQRSPSGEMERERKKGRKWHRITEGTYGQKTREGWKEKEIILDESHFPSPVTTSSDSFVVGSLCCGVLLPECIRGVCNLTSQYWNCNASLHSINCCLVIGFQISSTEKQDVLADLIMLCHGGWWASCDRKETGEWKK